MRGGGGVNMKEFFLTLISVSLVCCFASMLAPDKKGGGLRSSVGFACGICALFIVVDPIISFANLLFSDEGESIYGSYESGEYDYEKIFDSTLLDMSAASIELELERMLADTFSLAEESIGVELSLAEIDGEYLPERVTVTLGGTAMLTDAHEIERCIEELLSCECRVIYKKRGEGG